jgi:hypothetical protein
MRLYCGPTFSKKKPPEISKEISGGGKCLKQGELYGKFGFPFSLLRLYGGCPLHLLPMAFLGAPPREDFLNDSKRSFAIAREVAEFVPYRFGEIDRFATITGRCQFLRYGIGNSLTVFCHHVLLLYVSECNN